MASARSGASCGFYWRRSPPLRRSRMSTRICGPRTARRGTNRRRGRTQADDDALCPDTGKWFPRNTKVWAFASLRRTDTQIERWVKNLKTKGKSEQWTRVRDGAQADARSCPSLGVVRRRRGPRRSARCNFRLLGRQGGECSDWVASHVCSAPRHGSSAASTGRGRCSELFLIQESRPSTAQRTPKPGVWRLVDKKGVSRRGAACEGDRGGRQRGPVLRCPRRQKRKRRRRTGDDCRTLGPARLGGRAGARRVDYSRWPEHRSASRKNSPVDDVQYGKVTSRCLLPTRPTRFADSAAPAAMASAHSCACQAASCRRNLLL